MTVEYLDGVVIGLISDERADHGKFIGHLRQPRKCFANLESGHVRRDRPPRAGNFFWRQGLQVEHVLVGRPTDQVDHDHRLDRTTGPGRGLPPQELGQRQAADAQRPDLEEIPPRQPIAERRSRKWSTLQRQHARGSECRRTECVGVSSVRSPRTPTRDEISKTLGRGKARRRPSNGRMRRESVRLRRLPFGASPFPRRHRIRFSPQPPPMLRRRKTEWRRRFADANSACWLRRSERSARTGPTPSSRGTVRSGMRRLDRGRDVVLFLNSSRRTNLWFSRC